MLPRRRRNSSSVRRSGGRAQPVVFRDACHGVSVGVAHVAVEGHPQEVLVRTELLVGHHARRPLKNRRAEERVAGLLETRGEGVRAAADVREADRHGSAEPLLRLAHVGDELLVSLRRDAQERPRGVVAPVEQRARDRRGEEALELVGGRRGREDDVALVEVAAQPGGPALEPWDRLPAGELLEEVLDEVLLRQSLDQLDLLDRHGDLVGDDAREVDLRGAGRGQEAEQLVVCDERYRHGRRAALADELGA